MNNISLVGCVYDEPNKFESSNGLKCCRFRLNIEKTYKDSENQYEVFEVCVFKSLAELDYKVGQLVSVTGKLQANNVDRDDKTYYNVSIIGSSISFPKATK